MTEEELKDFYIRPEAAALVAKGKVTKEDLQGISLNSWEQEELYPVFTTDYLIRYLEDTILPELSNRHYPAASYDEAASHIFLPLVIERLKETLEKLKVAEYDVKYLERENRGLTRSNEGLEDRLEEVEKQIGYFVREIFPNAELY